MVPSIFKIVSDRRLPYSCLFSDVTWDKVICSSLVLTQTLVHKKFHHLSQRELVKAVEQFAKDKYSPACRVHQVGRRGRWRRGEMREQKG
jgi:hypothetical protein